MRSRTEGITGGQDVEVLKVCPLCGSGDLRVMYDAAQLGAAVHRIDVCRHCDLGFTNPRPSPSDTDHRYRKGLEYDQSIVPEEIRRELALDAMRTLRPSIRSRGTRALDVGCGDGSFLEVMRALGWSAVGVELSGLGADAARRRGLEVIEADFRDATLPEASFDLVTFWHVVEHLRDPVGAVGKARALLREGGILVVAVPNIRSWQAQVFGPSWHSLSVPDHLFHFSPRSLATLVRSVGFQVLAVRSANALQAAFAFPPSCAAALTSARTRGRWKACLAFHVLYRLRHLFLALERELNRCGSMGVFAMRMGA